LIKLWLCFDFLNTSQHKKNSLACSGFLFFGTASADVSQVPNGNNDGLGPLREALASDAHVIKLSNSVRYITITETLVYEGLYLLTIFGSEQTIDASRRASDANILSITQGANLMIDGPNFVGSSSEVNNDLAIALGGKDIFMQVPLSRDGLVTVVLRDVSVTRVGLHGIHVSDCSLGDDCGGGGDGV